MSFTTILLTMFMVMFWIFRAIVTLCTQFSIDLIGLVAYNFNVEVFILFATLAAIVLVVKRNIVGGLLYLMLYGVYFGEHLIANILGLLQGNLLFNVNTAMNMFVDVIAVGLCSLVLIDILLEKLYKANPVDKNTDWYFKNEKYDEELKARDQREDKNQYKFY